MENSFFFKFHTWGPTFPRTQKVFSVFSHTPGRGLDPPPTLGSATAYTLRLKVSNVAPSLFSRQINHISKRLESVLYLYSHVSMNEREKRSIEIGYAIQKQVVSFIASYAN